MKDMKWSNANVCACNRTTKIHAGAGSTPPSGTPISSNQPITENLCTAAPITDHRSPITDPPVPLFPRAANPAAEFQAVLDLARASATRHAVADIEDGNYAAALAKLDALAAGAFHWRGAVSNGYQQGFFLYALRGYCLEQMHDHPRAYRAYLNSTSCVCNDSSHLQRKPLLEVYGGIGRMCNALTRYADALSYFTHVMSNLPKSSPLYWPSISGAISANFALRRFNDADSLYATMVANDMMPTKLATCAHIVLLFRRGEYAQGITALFDALGQYTIDDMEPSNDKMLELVRTYVHHFSNADLEALYGVMGRHIARNMSNAGMNRVVAYCRDMRGLMRAIYPEMLTRTPLDDPVIVCAGRPDSPAGRMAQERRPLDESAPDALAGSWHAIALSQNVMAPYDASSPVTDVEDKINSLLFQQLRGVSSVHLFREWQDMVRRVQTNNSANIMVDGMDTMTLACCQLLSLWHISTSDDLSSCLGWILSVPPSGNRVRLAHALLASYAAALGACADTNIALRLLDRAARIAGDYPEIELGVFAAKMSCRSDATEMERLASYAARALARSGDSAPRDLYVGLARYYYGVGEFEQAYHTMLEGIVRTPLIVSETKQCDPLVLALCGEMSYKSSDELCTMRDVIRSSALRLPCTTVYVELQKRYIALADDPALLEHITLAQLEEGGMPSLDAVHAIVKGCVRTPRAGLLIMQLVLAQTNTYVSWLPWMAAFSEVRAECHDSIMMSEAGTHWSYAPLLNIVNENWDRIDPRELGFVKNCLINGVPHYPNTLLEQCLASAQSRGDTQFVTDLCLKSLYSTRTQEIYSSTVLALALMHHSHTDYARHRRLSAWVCRMQQKFPNDVRLKSAKELIQR